MKWVELKIAEANCCGEAVGIRNCPDRKGGKRCPPQVLDLSKPHTYATNFQNRALVGRRGKRSRRTWGGSLAFARGADQRVRPYMACVTLSLRAGQSICAGYCTSVAEPRPKRHPGEKRDPSVCWLAKTRTKIPDNLLCRRNGRFFRFGPLLQRSIPGSRAHVLA